jgi:polyisoprenoid-binding protein YceI
MNNRLLTSRAVSGIAWILAALSPIAGYAPGLAVAADAPAAPQAPPAGQYQLDKGHASLLFRVSHLGFSSYTTRFSRFDAQLSFDPTNLAAAKVSTTIDASSIALDNALSMCDGIVHGPQFLDTAKYPEITFKSEQVRVKGPNSLEVIGKLTLHGVTKPVVLETKFNGGYAGMAGNDPQARVGFSAHGSLKRSDFGMTYAIPAPGSTFGVGDTIEISIEAEFVGPPLQAAPSGSH